MAPCVGYYKQSERRANSRDGFGQYVDRSRVIISVELTAAMNESVLGLIRVVMINLKSR